MKRAYIYLHLAVLLASLTGIFGKLITLNAEALVFYRTLFAAIGMGVLARYMGKLKRYSLKETLQIMLAGFVISCHWIAFYASIKLSNVSIGVVCFCLSGFFTALFKPLFQKTKLSVPELLLSLLVLAGIVLIFSFDTTYRLGISLGIFAASLAAIYTLLNDRLIHKYDVFNINFYQMTGGFIIAVVLMLGFNWHHHLAFPIPDGLNLSYLLILSLLCTVLLYILVLKAQQKVSAFTVNLSFNLEPIYSIILAIIFFHENKELHSSFYIGCSLIVLSIVIQMVRLRQKRQMLQL